MLPRVKWKQVLQQTRFLLIVQGFANYRTQTMQSVNSHATWTVFNKRDLRMKVISMIMQLGQPLFWMIINPNDKSSPFVTKVGGIDLDVCTRLEDDIPP